MHTVTETKQNAEMLARTGGDMAGRETYTNLLLGGAAINLAIIAQGVAKLMVANPDPKAPMTLRDLTPEEARVVDALRAGDLKVVAQRDPGQHRTTGVINGSFRIDERP